MVRFFSYLAGFASNFTKKRMSSLVFSYEFSEHFFYRAPTGDCFYNHACFYNHFIADFFYFSVILINYMLNSSKYLENLICVLGISLPWDGSKTSFSLEKTVNWFLYNRFIVNKMKEMVLQ